MKETRIIMGMPISIVLPVCPVCGKEDRIEALFPGEIDEADNADNAGGCSHMREAAGEAFTYLDSVDRRFSPFKEESEVCAFRRGEVTEETASKDLRRILRLCKETKYLTEGYFDAWAGGVFDPSGLVKGWSLHSAARLLENAGFSAFAIDGAGDIEVKGLLPGGRKWRIGIRNPFEPRTIIRVLAVADCGVATSGTYIRGQHIFDPFSGAPSDGIASITVVGPNVFEADRLATAAFVMGYAGIEYLSALEGIEAYLVDRESQAVYTRGLERYLAS
jgi:thiamine biosynthesis lipoprotein